MTLFENNINNSVKDPDSVPLADRMRPDTIEGFVGQAHLVGPGKILRQMIEEDRIFSMIFWGPPGCGKTTLAKIIAKRTRSRFVSYSAVVAGIKQIKEVMEIAQYEKKTHGKQTVLFIDEIHRFNKAQQDAFLPYVEDGTIILIGATTENPSFEIISALLSRCKVFILNKLSNEEIASLLSRALSDDINGFGGKNIKINKKTTDLIAEFSDGDTRIAYNILEMAVNSLGGNAGEKEKVLLTIDTPVIENIIQKKMLLYDKNGEEHFNLISALHKSLRGSDPDAAAYWIIRMIEGGEDPLYILRRMVRFASEDIGLADPSALNITVSAKNAFEFIGPPEGYLAILEAAVYLALAPKSNSLYKAYKNIEYDIDHHQALPVPLHIRNAPTRLMKEAGYSKGYKYPHDYEDAIVSQSYLPDNLKNRKYYDPVERGFEKELKERLKKISEYKKRLEGPEKSK